MLSGGALSIVTIKNIIVPFSVFYFHTSRPFIERLDIGPRPFTTQQQARPTNGRDETYVSDGAL